VKQKRQRSAPRSDERGSAPAGFQAPSQNKPSVEISNGHNEKPTAGAAGEPSAPVAYPLFESVLRQKGLKLKGIYTVEDAREIFGAGKKVSRRTIQDLISSGELPSRRLPGNGRLLAEDFETYLRNSVRKPQRKCFISRECIGYFPLFLTSAQLCSLLPTF
jgi:hypothetical protein